MIRIGIDIGGTFTDFVVWHEAAAGAERLRTLKLSSTPREFHLAVVAGLEELLAEGVISRADEIVLVHGTTVSTNTVIERTGSDVALLVTEGMRDILNIQRLRLDKAVDLFNRRPLPLIPRERVHPVAERLDASGRVLQPIDLAAVHKIGETLVRKGITNVALCFLHSYRNASHEAAAASLLRESFPKLSVTASSEIWPQQSEYERALVAVLNAYVRDKVAAYIGHIQDYLQQNFENARLFITRSNGGVMSATEACATPVHTLLSGPASGVTACAYMAAARREPMLLAMDMGGTSTDLSLVRDAQPLVSNRGVVGDFPLHLPVTGIEAIGAGGGSIAAMDGPVLTVGPRSAGATPGPACYDLGGEQPTLTDAYLLCGYIDPGNFLGGRMRLKPELAAAAMDGIAAVTSLDRWSAAEACIAVATSNMVARVLPYLARMGADPDEVTLLAYGGAGPIHAVLLAAEIGVDRVLVPAMPAVFCAFGGTVAALMHDITRSVQLVDTSGPAISRIYGELQAGARHWLDAQVEPALVRRTEFQFFAEARYLGQSFNVSVMLPEDVALRGDLAAIQQLFHDEHRRLYAHANEAAPVEIVELRIRVMGQMAGPSASAPAESSPRSEHARTQRRCRFGQRWHDTAIIGWSELAALPVSGPAIVEWGSNSALVPPGFAARADDGAFIEITRER